MNLDDVPAPHPKFPANPQEHVTRGEDSLAEGSLVRRLRAGDDSAFQTLIRLYHNSMLRLAMLYVPSRELAEEVVQETWLGVLNGLAQFQGRASLKTWIFAILIHRAKTRGRQESHSIPFSRLLQADADSAEPSLEPRRFFPSDHHWAGHWVSFPRAWDAIPDDELLSNEVTALILDTIQKLEPSQQEVITLRDIEGWTAKEVCNVLQITETNQRVLLHRARSKVRRALEIYFDEMQFSSPT